MGRDCIYCVDLHDLLVQSGVLHQCSSSEQRRTCCICVAHAMVGMCYVASDAFHSIPLHVFSDQRVVPAFRVVYAMRMCPILFVCHVQFVGAVVLTATKASGAPTAATITVVFAWMLMIMSALSSLISSRASKSAGSYGVGSDRGDEVTASVY